MMGLLEIKKGDTLSLRFALVDEDSAAIDISSYTSIKFKLAKNLSDADDSCIEYFEVLAVDFTDPTNGIHDENIDDEDTAAYTAGDCLYQARWIDGNGVVTSFDVGPASIKENLIDNE